MAVIKRDQQALEVRCSREHYEEVKDLMRCTQRIEPTGIYTLRPTKLLWKSDAAADRI